MKTFIIGKRISLHGLSSEDLRENGPYYSWLNDLSLDIYTERGYFPNNPERMLAYYKHACQNSDLILMGIYDNDSGKHIGNMTFQEINWIQRRAFIAYLLGDNSFAGKGIVTDACLMLMYYGFNKLNFERIWGGVSEKHTASRRICEKVGLLEEGRMRSHLLRNGEFCDAIVVGALRGEWMAKYGEIALSLCETPPT